VDSSGECCHNSMLHFFVHLTGMVVLSAICVYCSPVKWQTLTTENLPAQFYFNLDKTASETYEMLRKVFCGDTMSGTQTFEWYSHFKWPYYG
jgi:hypothetical protein